MARHICFPNAVAIREIPFDFAQGRHSFRLKKGFARDDADSECYGNGFAPG
jgi:hypothetical protein